MNKVILVGRLVANPELRYTMSNKAYSQFTVAVDRPKINDKETITDFINCRVWNKQAENLSKYQSQGDLVCVEGRMLIDKYTDDKGNNRTTTYVLAENIQYLRKKNDSSVPQTSQSQPETDPYAEYGEQVTIDDDFLD